LQDTVFSRLNGQVGLYEWVADVREVYASRQTEEQPEREDSGAVAPPPPRKMACFLSDPHTLRPRTRTAQALRDRDREAKLAPLIFHGGTIVDRKSVF
jgi:hypothetical protein